MAGELTSFSVELRRRRLARGLSLGQFAARVHYSKSYLSKIETGQKRPGIDLAKRCDAGLDAGGELLALMPAPGQEKGLFAVVWILYLIMRVE